MQQNEIATDASIDSKHDNMETYTFDKRVYIVEPVYKENGSDSFSSKLIRLMKAEGKKH